MPKERTVHSEGALVIPGDIISKTEKGGKNSQTRKGGVTVRSTVVGNVEKNEEGVVCVKSLKKSTPLPSIGSVCLGKVTKVAGNMANIDIFTINEKLCHTTYKGTVRTEDAKTQPTSLDAKPVQIYECLKPNDVVRAEVTGLGDRRSYQLSTIRNEMGVVYATSLAGHQLIPLNDEEMQCTGTGQIEQRKVALGGQDFWWI
eukprot:TRINITY_DN1652_c0_g1_i1.p1 TRINITY_DN1652_c0_g1~~TRINITY_DN1652_c0_g1_i1.p1  ORF type:complete len:201 (+),score=16.31 TRINITY_DN1652_c0_g1_i1:52-654(+)